MNTDEWFKNIRKQYASEMECGKGCTACCHGLFDISLADAADVARGFQKLPDGVQQWIRSKAVNLHDVIRRVTASLSEPTLFDEDDPRIDQAVEAVNNPPCPCLGDAGECLIYEDRPLACRLEGVPMVDVNDGLFGDWCELNFKDGVSEKALADLKQDYDEIGALQDMRSAMVARRARISDPHAVTFIASVIAEHDRFWGKM